MDKIHINTTMPLNFKDLFQHEGLSRLDGEFLEYCQLQSPELHQQLLDYREGIANMSSVETSDFLVDIAKLMEPFIAKLFQIESDIQHTMVATTANNAIAQFKKRFVSQVHIRRRADSDEAFPDFQKLHQALLIKLDASTDDLEFAIAHYGNALNDDNDDDIEQLTLWCIQAMKSNEGRALTKHWSMFKLPQKLNYQQLIPVEVIHDDTYQREQLPSEELRQRDGFKLTDNRMSARQVQDEVNYCIYCHDHHGDLCSKGFPVKKGKPELGFRKNPLDITLTGCPIDEKISEMHLLKRDGYTLAALAMIMRDNPMCPITGHRICNDCMKACIYQKQTPVNIPQIETRCLTDVLALPWGVEIYDLFTRWNPLRQEQWIQKPYNGLKVLIAGMGPSGFTLAHHLLQEGFAVVGFDGLKIEPLPKHLLSQPIRSFDTLKESLDTRLMAGFGGVAEYGITVRWDKNFLKLIYLSLMRREHFQVFGNVRFGGTITVEDAWQLGFDHMVLAVGAGLPKALPVPGSMAPGMRQANDFLMALQLTGAAKKTSLTNLQLRLPCVVVGGGLTGVDAATEAQAYYIVQVEKILERYETLVQHYDEKTILSKLDIASQTILDEFLSHGRAVKQERARATKANETPDFIRLIRDWGGVTIAYRRNMNESPAYVNNYEELHKALEEGLYYLNAVEPKAAVLDEHGHVSALKCSKRIKDGDGQWQITEETIELPAKSILVATGASPNIAYEFEHRGTFERNGMQYQRFELIDGALSVAPNVEHCKEKGFGPFTSYQKDDYRVTFMGDTHPVFHGNVVKAVASGMRTYPHIVKLLEGKVASKNQNQYYQDFKKTIQDAFTCTITNLERKTNDIIEITIYAPLAVEHYSAGQFYRLQNYETRSQVTANTSLQTEGVALLASNVDHDKHEITFMVIESGTSSRLISTFKVGDPIALMGPTGVRSKISEYHETLFIIGGKSA
ncbi:MAG: FAD-dependent oxidoreductase [Gammaproteobacteria bacterium]